MNEEGYGALAAALAKAQAAFPAISRDKEVRVTSERTGKSYTFKYAPLDSILTAVRKPLSDNGLAIVQLLDEDVLVTSLIHESGAIVSGRTPIPAADGIQAYGSAITYLRRYAIQALLGIAAEEDDDGNTAAGNRATFGGRAEPATNGGLIGTAVKQKAMTTDFLVRQSPDGPFLGFRLASGAGAGVICEVRGPLAEALVLMEDQVIGQRVQVWGSFVQYEPPTVKHPYRAFRVTRIETPTGTIPAAEGGPGEAPQAQAATEPPLGGDGAQSDEGGSRLGSTTVASAAGSRLPETQARALELRDAAPATLADAPTDAPETPHAAGESVTEPNRVTPSAPTMGDNLCGADSPYGDNEHCELLTGHKGPHKVLSTAFPESWNAA